ncbi:MAG: hypothetical protein JW820_10670 [Spirochaetales bacterium]|nr:hypothetical protein [Spirochaetales bacterium]
MTARILTSVAPLEAWLGDLLDWRKGQMSPCPGAVGVDHLSGKAACSFGGCPGVFSRRSVGIEPKEGTVEMLLKPGRLIDFGRVGDPVDQVPEWWKRWNELRQRGVSFEKLLKLNSPNAKLPGPLRGKGFDYPSDYRPAPERFPKNVVICLGSRTGRDGRTRFLSVEIPINDLPKRNRPRAEREADRVRMEELFTTHGKFVQWTALRLFRKYSALAEQHLGMFKTVQHGGYRAEDFESLIWEAILFEKGTGVDAIEKFVGAWVRDGMESKGKHDIRIISLTEKLDHMWEWLRSGGRMTPAIFNPDQNTRPTVRHSLAAGPRWGRRLKKSEESCDFGAEDSENSHNYIGRERKSVDLGTRFMTPEETVMYAKRYLRPGTP